MQIEISGLDKRITQTHRVNADSKRLDTIPGFGVILSTAVVATMTDPKAFKTGCEFAARHRIGAAAELHGRGGLPRLDFQAGRSLSAPTAVVAATSVINSARARPYKYPGVIEFAGSAADQGGCGGAGQQDGADRLGRAGQGRAVSGANTLKQSRRPSGGLNR